jgi:excisionase family DNA binding protein
MNNSKAEIAPPLLVSVVRAAELLGISRHTAYAWLYGGKLPCVRLGGRVLIRYADLERITQEGLQ